MNYKSDGSTERRAHVRLVCDVDAINRQTLPRRRAGDGAHATDASSDPGGGFQFRRYPTQLIDVWHLRDGTRVTLRPVLPQDAPLLGDMLSRLSPTARRNRFHGAVNQFSITRLNQMTCVDYMRHFAFVITTEHHDREQVIADARFVIDDTHPSDSAEFAIVVDDTWQRLGLGERAMRTLANTAAQLGVRWLHGDVLAHNRPMLALMNHCCFCCTPDLEDEGLVHAEFPVFSGAINPRPVSTLARLRRWLPWRRGAARAAGEAPSHGGFYA
jgi:RimJ/RimL family protein N-acetyltransferase